VVLRPNPQSTDLILIPSVTLTTFENTTNPTPTIEVAGFRWLYLEINMLAVGSITTLRTSIEYRGTDAIDYAPYLVENINMNTGVDKQMRLIIEDDVSAVVSLGPYVRSYKIEARGRQMRTRTWAFMGSPTGSNTQIRAYLGVGP